MKKTIEDLFAVTAPGLETVCASELAALGLEQVQAVAGGVAFRGDLRDLYRANLWSRMASRILVRAGEFGCRDFPELYRRTVRLPWGRFIRPGTPLRVRAVSRRSRLIHTGRIAETVEEAIHRVLGGTEPGEGPEQRLLVHVEDDRCRISVDSSGDLLHRRGYRVESGPAPLRETLAAGMLALLGWDGTEPLLDPLCGSGTLLIEGGLLARRLAPGRDRSFAFMYWPGWRPGLWQALLQEARSVVRGDAPPVYASDRDAAVLDIARRNAERAGAIGIDFRCCVLSEAYPPHPCGLLICNPPYGERLEEGEDLRPLFRTLGEVARRFSGWRIAFLCPEGAPAQATGLPLVPAARLVNGGIPVTLFVARM